MQINLRLVFITYKRDEPNPFAPVTIKYQHIKAVIENQFKTP